MKEKIKILSYASVLLCFSLLFMATTDPPTPGNNDKTEVSVDIGSGYLGVCSAFHEGVKPLNVKIFVDVLENGQIISTFSDYQFNITNETGLGNENNYIFNNIEVPESGNFGIYVEIVGNACFNCCPNSECDYSFAGIPSFEGASATYNLDNVPSIINVYPTIEPCN